MDHRDGARSQEVSNANQREPLMGLRVLTRLTFLDSQEPTRNVSGQVWEK